MTEQDLKLQALERTGGDIDKAKAIYAWLTEVAAAPPAAPPEPAPTPSGIVLTDAEILTSSADMLAKLAMKRLADKQNDPSRIKTFAPDEPIMVTDIIPPVLLDKAKFEIPNG